MIKKTLLNTETLMGKRYAVPFPSFELLEKNSMGTALTQSKKFIFVTLTMAFLSSCALLSSDEDATKNKAVKVMVPQFPFEEVDVTSADRVWQNKHTGNTIAYNSACKDSFKKEALDSLEQNILAGVDNLKVLSKENRPIDGVTGEHTRAEGQMENVKVIVDLVTYKKGNCAYDLAYVGRITNFPKDLVSFEQFVSGFHTP